MLVLVLLGLVVAHFTPAPAPVIADRAAARIEHRYPALRQAVARSARANRVDDVLGTCLELDNADELLTADELDLGVLERLPGIPDPAPVAVSVGAISARLGELRRVTGCGR